MQLDGGAEDAALPDTALPQSWQLVEKITAPTGRRQQFGKSVSIDGDLMAGGSPEDSGKGFDNGTVQVFRRSGGTWQHEATLDLEDEPRDAGFGGSVSVSGNRIIVGASMTGGNNDGAAYIFNYVAVR